MKINRHFVAALAALVIASPVLANVIPTPAAAQQTTVSSQESLININTASVNDLMKAKGMTVAKARAIVSFRQKNGGFKSLDELHKVKGFIRMKANELQSIEDQLTI